MTDEGRHGWRLYRSSPLLELLTAAVIVAAHALVVPKLRLASDALFLEGATLSVIGALLVCIISDGAAFRVPGKKSKDAGMPRRGSNERRPIRSLLTRRYGYRILFIGLVLVGAAIVIGELFVRPTG